MDQDAEREAADELTDQNDRDVAFAMRVYKRSPEAGFELLARWIVELKHKPTPNR